MILIAGIIILVGLVLWAVNKAIPMEAHIKNIFNIVVVVVLVIWLMAQFGIFDNQFRIPK